ncbi:MAG: hypothetical protein WD073_01870 [Xanthobacteraceae bacterium]
MKTFMKAAAAGLAALFVASAAHAQCAPCGPAYQPGLLAALADLFTAPAAPACAPCPPVYQGPYMVNRGPVYSGPAVIAPPSMYSPTPPASGYSYMSGYLTEPAKTKRAGKKGGPEVVRARAEVKIYSPERMDIHLYREQ